MLIILKRLSWVLILLAPAQMPSAEVLVLGSLENDVRRQVARFTPLADYLETALAPHGISEVQITVMREDQDIAGAISSGDIDLYFDTPVIAAKVARDSGAIPLLKQYRNRDATFRSMIVAPVDGPVQTLDDLVDRKIGFEERSSSAGFLLPVYLLDQAGLKLAKLRTRHRDVPAGKVGYVFTGDCDNTMYWLVRGWVDAGAINDIDFRRLDSAFPGQFRVLSESRFMPREVVMQRPNMEHDLSQAISDALTSMHETPEGRVVIKGFSHTDRFERFPDIYGTFQPIFAILNRLISIGMI